MNYDDNRIDEAVLALLATYCYDNGQVWKGFDFDVMDRLYQRGLISQPHNKNKSVWMTPEGRELGQQIAARLFAEDPSEPT